MTAPSRRSRGQSPPDHPVLKSHQRFIRALPCVARGKPAPSECAQVGMFAGIGLPPGDRHLVPLCGPPTVWQDCCHSRRYCLGPTRFWSELGIDPRDLAAQLWRVSGNVRAGAGWHAVMLAREGASRQRPFRKDAKGSSPRCVLDRGTALRDRLKPTAIVTPSMSSELPLLVENRS